MLLKAKDLATEITIYNAKDKGMKTESKISEEHISNNKSTRKMLISRGIVPEKISASEDVKKVNRKIETEKKKEFKNITKSKK